MDFVTPAEDFLSQLIEAMNDADKRLACSDAIIKNGIKIMGEKNILNKLPTSSSSLYAKNVFNFVFQPSLFTSCHFSRFCQELKATAKASAFWRNFYQ